MKAGKKLKVYPEVKADPYDRRLKVGHVTYRMRWLEGLRKSAEKVGITNAAEQDIIIDKEMGRDHERETAFHEVMHAAWDLTSLRGEKVDSELEEQVIGAMSPYIVQVLRDNPWFVAYLLGGEL